MSFLDNLIKIDVKENMGIVGATDEFFCLFLKKTNNQKKQRKRKKTKTKSPS